MQRGKGKAKGSAFERATCKQLSLWVSHGKDEDLFWRSAISGGRATQGMKVGKKLRRQAGDICSVSAEGCVLTDQFFIECKHYRDLNILSFLINRRGRLAQFWETACREAKKHKKGPMLIAKQNNCPTLLIMFPYELPIKPIVSVPGICDVAFFDTMLKLKFEPQLFGLEVLQ